MSVVTVSKQVGSLGTEIAQAVAAQLHYDYVDKERIGEALSHFGMPSPDLEKFDEKKPPFWDSLQIQRRRFLHFLQAVIYDFARKGNVVIVGRGGQVLLKDLPGVRHVRIVAPFELRVQRLMAQQGGDEKLVARNLRRSDEDSAGFIHSFFEEDWENPNLYDLVINTKKVSITNGRQIILESLKAPEVQEGEKKADEKLADLALFQKVEATILGLLGIDIRHLSIQVEKGVVILRGAVNSETEKEKCERAVAGLEGVHQVDNHLYVTEHYRFGT